MYNLLKREKERTIRVLKLKLPLLESVAIAMAMDT